MTAKKTATNNGPIKADKMGDEGFAQLNRAYATMDVNSFRSFCINLLQSRSVSSKEKVGSVCDAIRRDRTNDSILRRVTNFYLAGEGLKVL